MKNLGKKVMKKLYNAFHHMTEILFTKQKDSDTLLFFQVMFLKGVGLILCDDIEMMVSYGQMVFGKEQGPEIKLIYYGIFTDFLLTHPLKVLEEAVQKSVSAEQSFDVKQRFEDLWLDLWRQK